MAVTAAAVTGATDMGEREINEEMTMSLVARQFAGGTRTVVGLRIAVCVASLALIAAIAVAMPDRAAAWAGINTLSAETSNTQAGGHPNVGVSSLFDTVTTKGDDSEGNPIVVPPDPTSCGCEDPRVITTHFPTGFIGDPNSIPRCTIAEFGLAECPVESQVGVVQLYTGLFTGQVALYNLEPHPDEAGLVGLFVPLSNNAVFISLSARTDSDYGLDATSSPIFHVLPLYGLDIHLFGVPADPENDVHRFPSPPPGLGGCFQPYPFSCFDVPSAAPRVPYLQNPTTCDEDLSAGETIEYYGGAVVSAETPWPKTTGCDQLGFNPSLSAHPTTEAADTASGVDVDLKVPQAQSPTVPSPSELRSVTVTFPEGFSINPNAADGKTSCADEEAAFGTKAAAHCPETSKVGTLTIDSSALPGPIDGAVYLGKPLPGSRYRIFLTADGFATHVKLAGSVHADEQTGQMEIVFVDLPQSPLQEFSMHFFGSERGLLATPNRCGTYPVQSEFAPWDSALASQKSTSFFTIDAGPNGTSCPGEKRPFAPRLEAGSAENTAGAHSPFGVSVSRDDGDQNLSSLTVKTPPGFAASLKGIPYCPESALALAANTGYSGLAELASPSCPAGSQIGVSMSGTGAGSHPLYLPGKVYLAGPYKGAPLSLAVVTPAVSGPYDLGNVVVRAAIDVDPVTAQVTTLSDPLPQILDGIPLRLRSIEVNLNRPEFALNPTSCRPMSVEAKIVGNEGAVSTPAALYQSANCGELDYGPSLSLRLTGGVRRLGHPAIHATLQAKPGEANSRSISVALPAGEQLDNSHLGTVCTRVDFAKEACPAGSVIGRAEATTPLLDQPLSGSVFLRTNPERSLPDLVVALKGQIDIEVSGQVDTTKGGALRTNFDSIPDAPISSFTLNLAGGSKGLLINGESLCGTPKKALAVMAGQNGANARRRVPLAASCGSKSRHKRHLHRARVAR